jgi:CubicO group peptidase (beta-lactamase class C family)
MKRSGLFVPLCACLIVTALVQRAELQSLDLDQRLSEIAARKHLPGFAVAVVSKDGVVFQKGYGLSYVDKKIPYTPQSVQEIGSVSKTFIGISLMQLVEQGRIQLDADINTYLPFKVVNPYFPEDPITVRHLATHTSTLKDTNDFWLRDYIVADPMQLKLHEFARNPVLRGGNKWMPMGQFIRNIVAKDGAWYSKSNFLKERPGKTFQYSNLGADLAAYIVECVTGESFAAYSDEHILKAIGMTHSGWSFDTIDMNRYVVEYASDLKQLPRFSLIAYPDGGLMASIEDMSAYVIEMIRGYQGEGKLLHKDSFREMMRPQSTYGPGMEFGIFCAIWGNGYIGHTGGGPGTTTRIFFDPKTNRGTVLSMNTWSDNKNDRVSQDFLEIERALGWP